MLTAILSTSVLELQPVLPRLASELGFKAQSLISGQYRVDDIRHCFADMRAVREVLQFIPEVCLEQGIDRSLRWMKNQETDRLDAAHRELLSRGIMAGICG